MGSAFTRELVRSVTRNVGRFAALAAIVGLGVGFFAGLRMTGPDMRLAADAYYDDTRLMDVRVVSTMGLMDEDVDVLRSVEGVDEVMGAYEADVLATIGEKQHTFRIHSLPASATGETEQPADESNSSAYLNRLVVVDGRMPETAGECVISADVVLEPKPSIGDVITVDESTGDLDDVLSTRQFTVVGTVHAPYYVESASLGTTSLGSGVIQEFIYVTESSFAESYPYTEIFLTVKGANDLLSQSDEYQTLVDATVERVNALAETREQARLDQLRSDAQSELDRARQEYLDERSDVEGQLADAQQQLNDAAAQIASSENQLADAQRSYNAGVGALAQERAAAQAALDQAQQTLDENEALIGEQQAQLDEQQAQVRAGYAQLDQAKSELAQQEAAWQSAHANLTALKTQYQSLIDAGVPPEQLVDMKAQIDTLQAQLDATRTQLDAAAAQLSQQQTVLDNAQAQIDTGSTQLAEARAALADARAQLEQQREAAANELANAQGQLANAQSQLANGYSQLNQGKNDYAAGVEEYRRNEADALSAFADAEEALDDAQREIDTIERPEWLVMDRMKNVGVVSFDSDASRIDNIASVFPFIFFLVAALVALTTMTRMVDEERILIGTYKALGYSRMRIASKYLLYAFTACALGSVVGLLALGTSLPAVIMVAYAIIYYVPVDSLGYDVGITAAAVGLGVGITIAATAAAAYSQLRDKPANLMLPRAPKAGKRILLEHITPVWSSLSFSWKVTMRNIFRYKRRFFMTLVGIAGCTALLLTGLGLHDSINDIIDVQYKELVHFNADVTRQDDATDQEIAEIEQVLDDESMVARYTSIHRETLIAQDARGRNHRVGLLVANNPDEFASMWTLRERVGHAPVPFNEHSVLVDEKLASVLGLSVGDSVHVSVQDAMGNAGSESYTFTITGIVENYIYDYLFVGNQAYRDAVGEEATWSSWLVETGGGQQGRENFDNSLYHHEGVKTLAFNDATMNTYRTMLRSVDLIVFVLIIAAALLAYIVLYNLTNINIEERVREIATLKVLGFTRNETSAYIFREILITVVLGCALGLLLGVYLEEFVIVSAEVDQVMFGRSIHVASFVIAFVLTIVFAVAVLVGMRGKLARIDMVESLKSIE